MEGAGWIPGTSRLDEAAAVSARNGLSNPREGTILSVMSAIGLGALNASPEGELTALLSAARQAADERCRRLPSSWMCCGGPGSSTPAARGWRILWPA